MTEQLITYASVVSPVAALLIGFKKSAWKTFSGRVILLLLAAAFLTDCVMLTLAKLHIYNTPGAHVYGLIEGVLLLIYFCRRLHWPLSVLLVMLGVYINLYLMDSIFLTGPWSFNAYTRSVESLLMITLAILFFHRIYRYDSEIFIDRNPDFWIVVGILVYFSGALFSFLLATDILSQSSDRFYGSWILHNVSNILKNILLAIGIWKLKAD